MHQNGAEGKFGDKKLEGWTVVSVDTRLDRWELLPCNGLVLRWSLTKFKVWSLNQTNDELEWCSPFWPDCLGL